MRLIPPEEMAAIDANCKYFGLLPLQLMENAGASLARVTKAKARGKNIAIVAGRGNNGGDAFAAARHLDGFEVTIFLLGRSKDIATEEAMRNWNILEKLGFDVREISDVRDMNLGEYDLIID